ncbi:MAG: hypothetical protein WCK89_19105, partial [bacterium]
AKVTREEQAAHELGNTEFARGTRVTLAVFFLAVIASVPLAQFCSALRQPERITRLTAGLRGLAPDRSRVKAVSGVVSAVNLLPSSSQIKTVEDDWEQNSVVGETLLPRVQSLMLAVGQGNEKAYLGRNGWLFYRPDLDYVTGRSFLDPRVLKRRATTGGNPKAPQPDPIKAIVHFRDQLAARGIALIVVPAPAKPSIYPECFSRRYTAKSPVVQNPSFEPFKSRLTQAGIAVFDPAPLLAEAKARGPALPLYLKTDTHWTPAAMELVAGKLADAVRSTVALPTAVAGRLTTVAKPVENMGDVAMMLKLPVGQRAFPPETVRIRQVLDGKRFLRADPQSEVLFMGDSFANIYSLEPMGWGEAAGLVEHLSLALGLPVDAICRNDAGSCATREMLAKELYRGNDRLAGKKVVIWEFASRELACGDWKLLPLVLGEKKMAGFYAPEAGCTVEVRAVVRAVSFAPRPGSVPYKDHILMLHLTDIETADDPSAAGKEAVVFAWSMRDNKSMPASRYRPGDAVRLPVQAWSAVASKYEKINRSELDDEKLLSADPAWAGDVRQERSEGLSAAGPDRGTHERSPDKDSAASAAGSTNAADLAADALRAAAGDGAFRAACATKAAAGDAMAVPGSDGWLFLRSELRHISVGAFWGEAARKVSKATSPDNADPLPAILDFNEQLKAQGIELILAPVPCKALVYPEKLDGAAAAGRLDAVHQQFFKLLGDKGVKVLDIAETFLKEKSKPGSPLLYCKTDTHWSPYACEVTARQIRELLGAPAWLKGKPDVFKTKPDTRRITGDLTDGKGSEELPVRAVEAPGGTLEDKASPVILLGDSHTLVFHAGAELHGTGAGLADQLAAELGIPVDVIGVCGSGATPARRNLIRRAKTDPAYLAGKKVVIWCFAAREFTESTGWSVLKLGK